MSDIALIFKSYAEEVTKIMRQAQDGGIGGQLGRAVDELVEDAVSELGEAWEAWELMTYIQCSKCKRWISIDTSCPCGRKR